MSIVRRVVALSVLGSALFACAPAEQEKKPEQAAGGLRLAAAAFDALPGWTADAQQEALPALARSCARLAPVPDTREMGPGGIAGRAADWRAACAALPRGPVSAAAARAYFERWFRPWTVTDRKGDAEGLVTGYYEAELNGALTRSKRYRVPVYARPADLVTVDLGRFAPDLKGRRLAGRVQDGRLVRYHDRAAIEQGALDGRARVLAWVDDPVDAFFLHIQGSGRVKLPGGGLLRIGYDGTNDLPFTAIGRLMIDKGLVPRDGMSMQAIRGWLAKNPKQGAALMRENARYVFFRKLTGDGPVGGEGVALTAGRSIAVDRSLMPYGAPVWLATTDPLTPTPMNRLVMAQDTGAAITGAVRADFFFGAGDEAARRAGGMKRKGRTWLLLPRGVTPPQAPPRTS